jgi:hypothetical protein
VTEGLCQAVKTVGLSTFTGVPPAGEHVWEWFWELDKGRSAGMELNRLSWSDLAEWQRVTGVNPKPWELRAIQAMDTYRVNPDYDPIPPRPVSIIASMEATMGKKAKK